MPIKPILRPVTIPERYILQWQEDGYLRNIGIKPYFQMEQDIDAFTRFWDRSELILQKANKYIKDLFQILLLGSIQISFLGLLPQVSFTHGPFPFAWAFETSMEDGCRFLTVGSILCMLFSQFYPHLLTTLPSPYW